MEITNCKIKTVRCEYVFGDDEKEKGLIILTIVVENLIGDFKIVMVDPNKNTAYRFLMNSIFRFAEAEISSELSGRILRMAVNNKEMVALGDPIKDEFALLGDKISELKLITEKELQKKFG